MKTIKVLIWLLALALGTWAAAEISTMTGMIVELTEDGFAFQTENGIRLATVSEDTALETDGDLAIGDVTTIAYSGMTAHRTLNTDMVICHTLTGTVTLVCKEDEPYFLMTPEDGSETVRVNLPDTFSERVIPGLTVTVYYNGARTRSVPPQIAAQYVRGPVLQGKITDVVGNDTVYLKLENGETVILHCPEKAIVLTTLTVGNRVSVSVTPRVRLSFPAQYEAIDILPMS